VRKRWREARNLERTEIGQINSRVEQARLAVREQDLEHQVSAVEMAAEMHSLEAVVAGLEATGKDSDRAAASAQRWFSSDTALGNWITQFATALKKEVDEQLRDPRQALASLDAAREQLPSSARAAVDRSRTAQREADSQIAELQGRVRQLSAENSRYQLTMATAGGQEKMLELANIVRAYRANQMSLGGRLAVYFDRWWEYLSEEPREANSEGGVLPAIWGTVVMTVVMSMLVVPFGVLAALYLREYARAGWLVSVIRISISNLAGVPSIVFGVFGLGFFCYLLGAYLDGGPSSIGLAPLAPRIWWLCLLAVGLIGLAAFATGLLLLGTKRQVARRWQRAGGYAALALWLAATVLAVFVLAGNPFFGGLFATTLPNPTLGKGGLLWASLTLSLLTLPVVIVATEEALASVPNSLREGSYACGASKWQTIRRIVLPHAMPGIMTGMILAMARGAGEVAPLMLVGAVKWQPELPMDGDFPFLHPSRSFMHLGFHIFDLGFQSQNSDAAKPMVFTTTMLLIGIIAILNLSAVWIRSKLRKRFQVGQF
jgi:ABC-type phosphate transport system permease subunit